MTGRLMVNEANTLKGSSLSTYPFAASLNSCDGRCSPKGHCVFAVSACCLCH